MNGMVKVGHHPIFYKYILIVTFITAISSRHCRVPMPLFTDDTFRSFLGNPLTYEHDWGLEWRFAVSKRALENYKSSLNETIYHHHSFFDLHNAIAEIGFPLSAKTLRHRYSGNPKDHKTRMGNLGEVIGAHLSRAYLHFNGEPIYPKRYNTNVEQSMKGIDILGFRDINSPAEIFVGEVKTGKRLYKSSSKEKKNPIEDAYETLCKHQRNEELPKILHFARAYFQDDKINLANVDRHMKSSTPRKYLLLSLTEQKPSEPFSKIPEYKEKYGVIQELIAVHIEMKGLTEFLEALYSESSHV